MGQQIDFIDLYDFLLKNEVTEAVTVVKQGEPCAVLLPLELYQAMRGTRKAIKTEELSQDDIKAIMDSEIPEEAKQFNHEVEEK